MMTIRLYATLISAVLGGAIASCASVARFIPDGFKEATTGEAVAPSSEETVDHGSDGSTDTEPQIFPINKRFEEGALTLDIKEVHLQAQQISIVLHVANPTDQIIRFYPNQGILSTGVDEFEANIFLSDEELSGAIAPRQEKSGTLVFSSSFDEDLNFSNVQSLQLALGEVIDMESITPHTVSLAFSLESES